MFTLLALACPLQATGTPATAIPNDVVSTTHVEVLDGGRVALVTDSGVIRLVELDSGQAVAETRAHAERRAPVVSYVDGEHVLTHDGSGRAFLRETVSMEAVASFEPSAAGQRLAVSAASASIALRTDYAHIVTARLGLDVEIATLEHRGEVRQVTFSPDGARLALLGDSGVALTNEARDAVASAIPFETDLAPSMMTFLDAGRIAVGFGDPRPDGHGVFVRLYDIESGEALRTIRAPLHLAPLSGFVTSMEYDRPSRTLVFGISSAGSLVAFDVETGTVEWSIEGTGGNPNGVAISHHTGSRFACVSGGASKTRSRVLDWTAGLEYGTQAFTGCHALAATRGDRFIVGVRPAGSLDGTPGLAVYDAETFELRYTRVEGRGPLAGGLVLVED